MINNKSPNRNDDLKLKNNFFKIIFFLIFKKY